MICQSRIDHPLKNCAHCNGRGCCSFLEERILRNYEELILCEYVAVHEGLSGTFFGEHLCKIGEGRSCGEAKNA
jgi:hypothetical protein